LSQKFPAAIYPNWLMLDYISFSSFVNNALSKRDRKNSPVIMDTREILARIKAQGFHLQLLSLFIETKMLQWGFLHCIVLII